MNKSKKIKERMLSIFLALLLVVPGILPTDSENSYGISASKWGIYITSDKNKSGANWSYDKNTSTLTLNDYRPLKPNQGIYIKLNKPIKIRLVGNNTIKVKEENYVDGNLRGIYGVRAPDDLTIEGNGSLAIETVPSNEKYRKEVAGIYSRSLKIKEDATVSVEAKGKKVIGIKTYKGFETKDEADLDLYVEHLKEYQDPVSYILCGIYTDKGKITIGGIGKKNIKICTSSGEGTYGIFNRADDPDNLNDNGDIVFRDKGKIRLSTCGKSSNGRMVISGEYGNKYNKTGTIYVIDGADLEVEGGDIALQNTSLRREKDGPDVVIENSKIRLTSIFLGLSSRSNGIKIKDSIVYIEAKIVGILISRDNRSTYGLVISGNKNMEIYGLGGQGDDIHFEDLYKSSVCYLDLSHGGRLITETGGNCCIKVGENTRLTKGKVFFDRYHHIVQGAVEYGIGNDWKPPVIFEYGVSLLLFFDYNFEIAPGFSGEAIDEKNFASHVYGGTKPYTFSKKSGPDWLKVSSDGKLTGIRHYKISEPDILVVQVSDNSGQSAEISVNVGAVTTPEIGSLREITVDTPPSKMIYTWGEMLDMTGAKVTAHYSSGYETDVTDKVKYDKHLCVGEKKITLKYQNKECILEGLTVNKKSIDLSNVAWDITGSPFTYDGTKKSIKLTNLPDLSNHNILNEDLVDHEAKDAGVYNASANFWVDSYYQSYYEITNFTDPLTVHWEIKKADIQGSDFTKTVIYDDTNVQTVSPKDFGTELKGNFELNGNIADDDNIIADSPLMGKNIKFRLKQGVKSGSMAVIPLRFRSVNENYNPRDFKLTIRATNKKIPTVSAENLDVHYTGNPVPSDSIRGSAVYEGADIPGRFSWKPGYAVTNAADSGLKKVVFTPEDQSLYEPTEAELHLNIQKVNAEATVRCDPVNQSDIKISDVKLTVENANPPHGNIVWEYAQYIVYVVQGKEYKWIYTPDNPNYNPCYGKLIPWQSYGEPIPIDVGGVFWDISESPFTYDGEEKTVKLMGLPENVVAEKFAHKAKDVGKYNATAVLKAVDNTKYKLVNYSGPVTAFWNINKAELKGKDVIKTVMEGVTEPQSVAGSSFGFEMPGKFSLKGVIKDTQGILSGEPLLDSSVTFELKDSAKAGAVATIPLTFKPLSDNYNSVDVNLEIQVIDKKIPHVYTQDINFTYTGEPVPENLIQGNAVFEGVNVPGEFSWAPNSNITNVEDSGSKKVEFTPYDENNYGKAEAYLLLTINKAKTSGKAKCKNKIDTEGKTLADAELEMYDTDPADGKVDWQLPLTTVIVKGQAYNWKYIPNNPNYEILTGSLVPWPSGGIIPIPPAPPGGLSIPIEDINYYVSPETPKTWIKDSNKSFTVITDAPVNKFKGILIDGTVLSGNDYVITDRGIEIRKEYMNTLLQGVHQVVIEYKDGKAKFDFEIKFKDDNNKIIDELKIKSIKLKLRLRIIKLKKGKRIAKFTWKNQKGKVPKFYGVEIYRSNKKYSGYGKKPIYITKKTIYYNRKIRKNRTYYYKIRGFIIKKDKKIYTNWSNKIKVGL